MDRGVLWRDSGPAEATVAQVLFGTAAEVWNRRPNSNKIGSSSARMTSDVLLLVERRDETSRSVGGCRCYDNLSYHKRH
jgi:hypothetical protein